MTTSCKKCMYQNPKRPGECSARVPQNQRGRCPFFLYADAEERKENTAPEGAEYALECIRDPEPFPGEDVPGNESAETAAALHRALVAIVAVSGGNSERLAVVVARYGGLSYAAIGARFGISRQAVYKHLLQVGTANPVLGQVMRMKHQEQEAISGDTNISQIRNDVENRIREITACLGKKN